MGGAARAAPGRAPGPAEFKALSAQYPDASFAVRRNAAGVATKQERHRVFGLIVTAARALGEAFPEVLAAQWALESAWGQSPSSRNNLFGIKARRGERAVHPGGDPRAGRRRNGLEGDGGVPEL